MADATDANHLLLSVLKMVFKLLKFGFFEVQHLQPLCRALVKLLDGRNDEQSAPSAATGHNGASTGGRGGAGVMVFSTLQRHQSMSSLHAQGFSECTHSNRGLGDGMPPSGRARSASRGPGASAGGAEFNAGKRHAQAAEGTRYDLSTHSLVAMDCKVTICSILMHVCQLRVHMHMASALQAFHKDSSAFEPFTPGNGGNDTSRWPLASLSFPGLRVTSPSRVVPHPNGACSARDTVVFGWLGGVLWRIADTLATRPTHCVLRHSSVDALKRRPQSGDAA